MHAGKAKNLFSTMTAVEVSRDWNVCSSNALAARMVLLIDQGENIDLPKPPRRVHFDDGGGANVGRARVSPRLLVCAFLSAPHRASSLSRGLLELEHKVLISPDIATVTRSVSSTVPDLVVMQMGSTLADVTAALKIVDTLHQRRLMSILLAPGSISAPLRSHAMRSGASEVLAARHPTSAIIDCVEDLSRRQGRHLAIDDGSTTLGQLTSRERHIVQLLVEGHDNKSIGAWLGLSYRTVEVYRRHLLDKVGVCCTGELLRLFAPSPVAGWVGEP